MDKNIEVTIKQYFGDLRGVTTDEFYKEYCYNCDTEPRPKNVVIREACDMLGIKTKAVYYRVFEN